MKRRDGRSAPGVSAQELLDAVVIAPGRSPGWYAQRLGWTNQRTTSTAYQLREDGLLKPHNPGARLVYIPTEMGRDVALRSDKSVVEFYNKRISYRRLKLDLAFPEYIANVQPTTPWTPHDQKEELPPEPVPPLVPEDELGVHKSPTLTERYVDDKPTDETQLVDQLLDALGAPGQQRTHRLWWALGRFCKEES